MSDALTLFSPDMLGHLEKMAVTLSKSSLIPDSLKNKPGDVLVTLMTGAELGLQPMQSLRSIAVVKGKPALSADLMVSLCKQRREVCEYLVLVESTPKVATYRAKRVGEPEPTTMSFSMEDAQRAGLCGPGGMYSKYPAQMLRARCASGICRAVFPDLTMGLYDSDSGELMEVGKPVEREINAAPAVRADEVRRDLQIVKAEAVTIDSPAVTAQPVETAPAKAPAARYGDLDDSALSKAIDETLNRIETAKVGGPVHTGLKMRLADLEGELESRMGKAAEVSNGS